MDDQEDKFVHIVIDGIDGLDDTYQSIPLSDCCIIPVVGDLVEISDENGDYVASFEVFMRKCSIQNGCIIYLKPISAKGFEYVSFLRSRWDNL